MADSAFSRKHQAGVACLLAHQNEDVVSTRRAGQTVHDTEQSCDLVHCAIQANKKNTKK
jgi:hypothetical protein